MLGFAKNCCTEILQRLEDAFLPEIFQINCFLFGRATQLLNSYKLQLQFALFSGIALSFSFGDGRR